jgi:carbonic anhydrase
MQTRIDVARSSPTLIAGHAEDLATVVLPSSITGTRPGELFRLRTPGSSVPPYVHDRPTVEAAGIEYPVEVLRAPDIVVRDRTHRGAVVALARGEELDSLPGTFRGR